MEKTTLTAAITMVLGAQTGRIGKKYDEIDSAPEEKARGVLLLIRHMLNMKQKHATMPT